jgi:hypothetical protein
LQKKGVKFEWTFECEEIFQHLKNLLTSAPILKIFYPNEDFLVCTYGCKEWLGGILSPNEHLICYESRKLKEHERHYVTHELESEAIIHALNMGRHYLMGKIFELRRDDSMKYFFGQPTLNARKIRWLKFLCEYDFDIKHIKGKENMWLMHSGGGCMDACYNYYHVKYDLKEFFLEASKLYQHYMKTKEKLQKGNLQ